MKQKQWYILKSPNISLEVRNDLRKEGIEFFLPTRMTLSGPKGQEYRVERPLVFNLLFLYSDFQTVLSFKDLHLVYRLHVFYKNRRTDDEPLTPLTVPDHQMDMFIKTVGEYNSTDIPYLKPSEIDLEKGDIVRITSGPFAGVEGTLISQQGKDGGRVLVSVSNLLAVPTLHIEPEYLQVLQFAKKGKHFYKQIDSYLPRLKKAMEEYKHGGKLGLLDPVRVFVFRFSELQADTVNAQAKVYALMLASYRLLSDADKANEYQKRLDDLMPKVKSDRIREFVENLVNS